MLLAGIVLASGTCCIAQETPKTDVPKEYASPQEVFEANQKACRAHDWRAAYFCLTPKRRENEVFESLFACKMHEDKPNVQAVLKKYYPGDEALEAEYVKLHQAKYGVDFKKLRDEYDAKYKKAVADYRKSHPPKPGEEHVLPNSDEVNVGPEPKQDEALLFQAVGGLIADKPGFFEAAQNVFVKPDVAAKLLGPLTDIHIGDDAATGRTNDGAVPILQHFEKLHGSWLMGQIEVIDTGPPRIGTAKH